MAAAAALVTLGLLFGGSVAVRAIGKRRLYNKPVTAQPTLQSAVAEGTLTEEENDRWQEGWVKYQDTVYEYNKELLTFLVMGIDKQDEVDEVEEGTDGGQADALFLVVLNPKDESIKVVGINRNTMTDVDIYDDSGEYISTVKAQLAIQHGFGNGMEESCEYQKKAVENLFYQLPIHGYVAVNMSAVSMINDAVGGVDVTVPGDLAGFNEDFVEGRTLHLMGENAFWYVKYRDTGTFGSADMRLDRQKQYLNGFINVAKQAVHENRSVVIDLYQAVKPQMVTDISLDEAAYLAPILSDYAYDEEDFYTLQGETVMGEQYEEFYPDEDAVFEMILDVFYEKVQ
ncbi:MAG: LytR family transcriptional regulator [Lachnospiraceae bacterium]|nr:LytR family transcriptional regulator [Lachnospiraceae bacterium]